jgi:hypothetical protein
MTLYSFLFFNFFFFSSSKVVYSHCYKYSICTWLPVGHSEFPLSLQLRAAVAKRVSTERKRKKKTLFFLFPPLKIYLWAKLRAITCVQQPREITRRNETRLFRKGKKYIYIIPNESKSNQINKVANEMKWNKNFIFFFSFSFRSETELFFLLDRRSNKK